ncbi:Membrane protein [Streptococcus pneumoniae]|nr:Membrane protein [Streptococcus pneumoniae]
MMVVLISVIVALLYHKITEYVNNRKIDIVIFLSLLISHFIWNYYFLPIEILIAISGANLLLSFLKKLQTK